MKVAYIIDSSASICPELKAREDVFETIFSIRWDDAVFEDSSNEAEMKAFYNKFNETDSLPQTSQPSPDQVLAIFEKLVEEGYDAVFGITISSSLSGSYQTMALAADYFKDQIKTYMVDSKGTSFLMERILIYAIQGVEAGMGLDKIYSRLLWFADEARIYVSLKDFETMIRGGRLSRMSGFLGEQLKIRPILYFDDEGEVTLFDKVRTQKRVYRRWMDLIQEGIDKYDQGIIVAFAHGDCDDEVQAFKARVQEAHPDMEFRSGYLTPVLGSHGGRGAFGMGILPKVDMSLGSPEPSTSEDRS